MFEDIYPEKRKVTVTDFDNEEELCEKISKNMKKINLYPKGQTVNRKPSKKARQTMKRAMRIRDYIKKDEKDKE